MIRIPHLVIKNEEQRIVYGEVYSPLLSDTDNEAMLLSEVMKAEQFFRMQHGFEGQIDVMHNYKKSGAEVVRSFIAMKNDPDGFIAGSWVLGVHVAPDDLWALVKKGELNGFSFAGPANRTDVEVIAQKLEHAKGTTENNLGGPMPPHSHPVELSFDEDGRPIPTKTGEVLGHTHDIVATTATIGAFDHSHPLVIYSQELIDAINGG